MPYKFPEDYYYSIKYEVRYLVLYLLIGLLYVRTEAYSGAEREIAPLLPGRVS